MTLPDFSLSLNSIAAVISGGSSSGVVLVPGSVPPPYTANNPTVPIITDTLSNVHYVQATGGNPTQAAANYVDSSNYVWLDAVNFNGGFILYLRVAGVDSVLINYTSIGGGITSAMLRRIQVEHPTSTTVKITVTVGATSAVYNGPNLSIGLATKVGLLAGSTTTYEAGQVSDPLNIVSYTYNPVARTADIRISFIGAPVDPDYYEYKVGAGSYADGTNLTVLGPGEAIIRVGPIGTGLEGTDQTFTLKQHNDPTQVESVVISIPSPMTLGINDSGESAYNDLLALSSTYWSTSDYAHIITMPYDVGSNNPSVTNVPATEDGLGGSVKRHRDGGIYGANSLGLTSYKFSIDRQFDATQVGTYTLTFFAGVTVSGQGNNANVTGWTYNSGTGVGSFTVLAAGQVNLFMDVNCASMGSNKVLPTLIKNGASGTLNPTYVSATQAIATILRPLDTGGANNPRLTTRTATAIGERTPLTRALGTLDTYERQVVKANALGSALIYLTYHVDNDAMITAGFSHIGVNLTPGLETYAAFSNEILFNYQFYQTHEAPMLGYRRGFGPTVLANSAAATPETIYDASVGNTAPVVIPCLSDGTPDPEGAYGKTMQAFSTNDKIYYGYGGPKVFRATTNLSSGTVFNANVGDANMVIHYTGNQGVVAGKRFVATRFKEMKILANAAFAAAGRANPKGWLDAHATSGFDYMQDVLDWDDLWQHVDVVAPAFYTGSGAAGGVLGNYADNTYPAWRTAKLGLYGGGTLASRIAAAVTAYFDAADLVVASTATAIATFSGKLRTYAAGKGKSIIMGEYEINDHTQFRPVSQGGDWPDTVLNESQQLFYAIKTDPRMYTYLTGLLNAVRNNSGGPTNVYVRLAPQISGNNGFWGIVKTEGDTDMSGGAGTNWIYKAIKDFKASL